MKFIYTTTATNFWRKMYFLRTKYFLFNPLAVPAPHRLSLFLAHQPSPHWKSQIAHSDMHHPVSGINSLIHSVSLVSHVSTQLPHSLVSSSLSSPPLSSSITPSLRAQNLPFQQILPSLTLLPPWTAFMITGPDRSYHASQFIFSLFFL